MLIYIAIVFCSLSSPDYCRQLDVPDPVVGVAACGSQAQMTAADWLGKHPGWSVQKWRCGMGKRPSPLFPSNET